MNDLNSVLIEGAVCTEPIYDATKQYATFVIGCERFEKLDNEIHKKIISVRIVCYNRLADTVGEQVHVDRKVRLVGRLHLQNTDLVIMAEHLEFKPVLEKTA